MKKTMLVLLMVVALAAMLIVPAYAEETTPGYVEVDGATAFAAAVETVKGTDRYIVLSGDITEDITVSDTVYVDLNGKTISGNVTIADDATLKVFDSATKTFETPETYGKITGTVTGDLARTMNTPKATYGNNYKYLAIKEADGYSFHRIYLTVKSVVLTPFDTGVNYRTAFKCNEVVARYIAENGYGVRLEGSVHTYEGSVVAGGDENLKITRVNKVLEAEDMMNTAAAQAKAETAISASAIVNLADNWTLSDEMTIVSAQVSRSLKDQITYASGKYHSLADDQQAAMIAMYNKYKALLSGWGSKEIGNVRLAVDLPDPISHCLCGVAEGEDHIGDCNGDALTWKAWNSTTTMPTENGYWYLAEPVTLSATWKLNDTKMDSSNVNVDLNGQAVTYVGGERLMTVYRRGDVDANIVITDSSADNTGALVVSGDKYPVTLMYVIETGNKSKAAVSVYRAALDASESKANGGDGGAIRVNAGQTLNLYGVEVKGCKDAGTGNGGAISISSGTVNIGNGSVITAAENCGGNGGAIYNDAGTLTITDATINGGKIKDSNNASAIANMFGGKVTIERSEINAADTKANYGGAIANSHANSTLTITDSTINGGKANYGGAIHNSGSLTITNSQVSAVEATNGGAIYNTGVLTLKDAIVNGAEADMGGALCVENGTVTLDGGKIVGANVTKNGCAIRYKPSAESTFTMTGNAVIDVTGKTAGNAGGAINIDGTDAKATFTMENGEIKGGTAVNGGVVVVQDTIIGGRGIFNMKGGTISGGTSAGGDNVRVTKGGIFNMSGGTITANAGSKAGVLVTDTGVMTISGTASITGNNGCDLYLDSGKSITIGTDWKGNGDTAMVVSMADGTGLLAESDAALTAAHAAYFSNANGVVVGYDDCLYIGEAPVEPEPTDPEETEPTVPAEPVGPTSHCLCGANNGEKHIGDCDETPIEWKPWNDPDHLPTENGNWYLVDNVTLTKSTNANNPDDATWRLNNGADNSDLKLDLNGKTINAPTGFRVMTVYRQGSKDANIVITDSSVGHTGTITSSKGPGATLFYLIDGTNTTKATVNVYRATLDASAVTASTDDGGAIRVNAGQTLNLYGAKLKGCTSSGSGGSALSVYSGTVNIKDGSVVTGKKLNAGLGGTIFNDAGTVNIIDSTVNGGEIGTSSNGGAINNQNGGNMTIQNSLVVGTKANYGGAIATTGAATQMQIINSTISGGTANTNGGAIHNSGTLTITGGTVTGTKAANGGAISNSKTLNITDSTINGGQVTGGGGAIYNSGTLTLKNTTVKAQETAAGTNVADNGGAIFSTGTVTVTGGEIIGGHVGTSGGAIAAHGGSFTVTDVEIDATGKVAGNRGAAVAVGNSGAVTFTMNGDTTIIGGTTADTKPGGGAVTVQDTQETVANRNAQFIMNGGIIRDGSTGSYTTAGYGGGNVRVTSGGKFYMNGGTITGGSDNGGAKAGGVMLTGSGEMTISGSAKITGNDGCDLYLNGRTITIGDGWEGNGEDAMVVEIANVDGAFTSAANATEEYAKHFKTLLNGGTIEAREDGLYIALEGDGFMIGYGEASINPYNEQLTNLQLSGYGTNKTPKTIDTYGLKAQCVAASDKYDDTVLLINIDLNYLDDNQSLTARNKIAEATGVPASNIMISADHVHSAPFVHKDNGGEKKVNVTLADGSTREMSYQDVVYEGLVAAAEMALADRGIVARISLATSQVNNNQQGNLFNVVRNYKAYDAEGNFLGMKTDNHQSYAGTAAYLVPESVADDTLQLVKYEIVGKDPLILANFQTHPHLASSDSSTYITSDIVGVFRETLASNTGSRVIYFSGAGGNVNPTGRGYTNDGWTKGLTSAREYGTALAKIAAVAEYTPLDTITTDVAVTSKSASTPAYQDTDFVKADGTVVDLETRRELADYIYDADKPTDMSRYKLEYAFSHGIYSFFHAKKIEIRSAWPANETFEFTLRTYAIGDIAFAAAPYEMYDTNGMEIKTNLRNGQAITEGNGFAMTFIATQANGTQGYFASQLGYDNGGYAIDVANVSEGTGERFADVFLEMLHELNPAE